jgi:hypothetical protein
MSACENFLKRLVTECDCCIDVTITAEGYGANMVVPEDARMVLPTTVKIVWKPAQGEEKTFTINNRPDEKTMSGCLVENLPCRP